LSSVRERYWSAKRADKGRILDELCATTGWHRDHARKALRVCADAATSNAGDKPKTESNGRIGLRLLDGRPFNDGHLAEFLARDL